MSRLRNEPSALRLLVTTLCLIAGTTFGLAMGAQVAHAADVAFTTASNPTISGTGKVGNNLSAFTNFWNPTPTTFEYQWLRNGLAINGANSSTYTLTGDDYLKTITIRVTGYRTGNISTARTSSSGIYVSTRATFTSPPLPTITGVYMVGESMYLNPGAWPAGTATTYKWFVGGVEVSGATSINYIFRPADKRQNLMVEVTANRPGYEPSVQRIYGTKQILPATPKVLFRSGFGTLTGKNTIQAIAEYAAGGTDRISTWCLTLDGKAVDMEYSAKGLLFTDLANKISRVVNSGSGCYTATIDHLFSMQMRLDVTNLTPGEHVITALAKDTSGEIGDPVIFRINVAKTQPVVSSKFETFSSKSVKGVVAITGTATTHSPDAPIRKWCLKIDSLNVARIVDATFKNDYGVSVDGGFLVDSDGCVTSKTAGAPLTSASISVDTTAFANGVHTVTLKVSSQDSELTSWTSPTISSSMKIKNPYFPQVTWNAVTNRVVQVGSASLVSGSITANIPSPPNRVELSTQDESGSWNVFWTGSGSNTFSSSVKLRQNSEVKVEIFDEDNLPVYSNTVLVRVSPIIKLAKTRVVLTGSTVSSKITKTVTVRASSSGLTATCLAKWPGGSKSFSMKNGSGSVTFTPSSSGAVTVACVSESTAPSKAVSLKY